MLRLIVVAAAAGGAILITICSLTFHFAANTNMSTLARPLPPTPLPALTVC